MKKVLIISSLLLLTSGCAILTTPGSGREATCNKLKMERLYYQTNRNLEASWLTRGQKERFEAVYKQNRCDEL